MMVGRVSEIPATFVIISGRRQQDFRELPGRELFTSQWFRKASAYAVHIRAQWYILSAAHGLVRPHDILQPRPLSFNDLTLPERSAWQAGVSRDLSEILTPGDRVILLAEKACNDLVVESIRQLACQLEIPLKNLKYGEQLAWFTKELKV